MTDRVRARLSDDDEPAREPWLTQEELERHLGMKIPPGKQMLLVGDTIYSRIGSDVWVEYGPEP